MVRVMPIVTTELLVPAGVLRVVDTWQGLVADEIAGPYEWVLTLRTAYLNGVMLWWNEASRDLLESAADVIDGGLRIRRIRTAEPGSAGWVSAR
jgi:hypothetical protein